MKSIKWKLIFMYLAMVLIVMIVSGTYIIFSLRSSEMDKARAQLSLYSEKIGEQVALTFEESQFQLGLNQFSSGDSYSNQIQGNILNLNGETIASTSTERPPFPRYKNSVILTAMAGEVAFSTNKDDNSNQWLSFAYPVLINGQVKYIIFAQMDAISINENLSQATTAILFSVLIAFILTAFMGYFFANSLTGPILMLTKKAKEMAEGNLSLEVTVYSDDEIGQLTKSFNFMSRELSSNISETTKEKNRLEIILHNMTDGVISYDHLGNLMLYNPIGLDILELKEMFPTLRLFLEYFNLKIDKLESDIDHPKSQTIEIGKKFIHASFSPYVNNNNEYAGVIVVLQDITEQHKLDDMRKEFVANVSHELRTPLTTIKSYTETMIDGAIEDRETSLEFLDIINSEADRMAYLVRDLLQLSRLDNNQYTLNFTEININQLILDSIRQNKIHAKNKNQEIYFKPYNSNSYIIGDRDRINQVLNNILTNAIKYSPNNTKIDINVTEDSSYYKIIVSDNGMGISKEDLPRIFERFYRVDKARSRAMGGTGLGLAIAKNIMENHGGMITAESNLGEGTIMTLWFLKDRNV